MGLFSKLLGLTIRCPQCNTPGAKDGFAGVKCQRTGCMFYDAVYATQQAQTPWEGQESVSFSSPISIQYENFRGETKTFVGESSSVRRRHAHISVAVQPTGRRIALRRDKIANLQEVENAAPPPGPPPRDAKVLAFHKKRGTTSPLYEELCRKYPDF